MRVVFAAHPKMHIWESCKVSPLTSDCTPPVAAITTLTAYWADAPPRLATTCAPNWLPRAEVGMIWRNEKHQLVTLLRYRYLSLTGICLWAACTTYVDAQANQHTRLAQRGNTAIASATSTQREPSPQPREFRAAWVATVNNIDFPSRPGLTVVQLKRELDFIVAQSLSLGLNALVFQVRPAGDAFYRSPLEPWSEWLTGTQGVAPANNFDPLTYIIARCHRSGMQLHAWFNPFRCGHPSAKSKAHASHVTLRAPKLTVKYGRQVWMDPGHPTAQKWSLAVIQDVVRRYDIDGVHIDDYFYPYPEKNLPFPDQSSYARYQKNGGKLRRADWRRSNIDSFVERMYRLVHKEKPWVMVGISPFGIAQPGVPSGIEAGLDQYGQLFADVPKWLKNGWLDYLAPQLYWPLDQKSRAFAVLLHYWHQHNPRGRAIWPGLYTSKIRDGGRRIRATELQDEIETIRRADTAMPGHIHFSFKALLGDHALTGRPLKRYVYRTPALAPQLPWLPKRN
jgi:uncharacterized lipoprotein YddW (UPF0748 family)